MICRWMPGARLSVFIVIVAIVGGSLPMIRVQAGSVVDCGSTITADTRLVSDVVCDPSFQGIALAVASDGVSIDLNGFSIVGALSGPASCSNSIGILLSSRTNVRIEGPGMIRNFCDNIVIVGGGGHRINGVFSFSSCYTGEGPGSGVVFQACLDGRGNGIHIIGSSNNVVSASWISGNAGFGVLVESSTLPALLLSKENQIIKNVITRNYGSNIPSGGIALLNSPFNTVSDNWVSENGNFGILIKNSTSNMISGNTVVFTGKLPVFEESNIGIALISNSTRNTLITNIIWQNQGFQGSDDSKSGSNIYSGNKCAPASNINGSFTCS